MPHSSGGGSSSGGSHSGSSGSSSGGSSGIRTASTYFPGATRYVYYHDGHARYYYRERPYEESDMKPSIGAKIILVFFMIFMFTPFFATLIPATFHTPKKLTMDYDTRIIVQDDTNTLTPNEIKFIETAFKNFQDKTGITPALHIIDNNQWVDIYDTLELYAYSDYVNLFADEKHWLIVYAYSPSVGRESFYWEGMQGDDTDGIITQAIANEFTENLHKKFLIRTNTIATAITKQFTETGSTIMDFHVDTGGLFSLCIVLFMFLAFVWGFFIAGRKQEKKNIDMAKNSVELNVGQEYVEDTCKYCGGVYVHGIHLTCPHCGASITPLGKPISVADVNNYK